MHFDLSCVEFFNLEQYGISSDLVMDNLDLRPRLRLVLEFNRVAGFLWSYLVHQHTKLLFRDDNFSRPRLNQHQIKHSSRFGVSSNDFPGQARKLFDHPGSSDLNQLHHHVYKSLPEHSAFIPESILYFDTRLHGPRWRNAVLLTRC
jgi:hypothetical protein